MDETGAYYTDWSKPERKTPIQYTNTHTHTHIYVYIYMEFRKTVMIALYMRQQKRHKCIEQSFGLCCRGWGWNDLGEWHWNMYIIICETDCQSRFEAWDRVLGTGALGWPRGMGEGFRMGNTCARVADQCQCMAKPLQYCKIISLQLKQ